MNLSKALEGFLFALQADGYSPSTIALYRLVISTLADYLNNPEVEAIKPADLTRYFAYLRTDYLKTHHAGKPLSGSTLQNHWKGIRCFFRWALDEFNLKARPDEKLKLPPNNPKAIMPLNEEEIKALLLAAEFTREVKPGNRKPFKMRRRNRARDLAIIVTLLDSGLRAGELGRLDICDVNLDKGEVYISPFGSSQRKTKSRTAPIGKAARRVIWRYLSTARKEAGKDEPLFISEAGRRMDTNSIRCMLVDLGSKAGIVNVHPHRLRHTFAVEYLRNGGDVFTLQAILGHSSLDMVRRYVQLAQADTQTAHRRASPADKWHL